LSTIEVVKDGGDADVSGVEEPAPILDATKPKSISFSLKEMRYKILSELYLDLKVPRWSTNDPEGTFDIYARYAPVRAGKIEESMKRRGAQEHNKDEAMLLLHVDVLVDSCRGIYAVLDGDMSRKYTLKLRTDGLADWEPTETWTRFDKDLARTLGLTDYESNLAEKICRALYLTDGDIVNASTRLSEWSAAANDQAEKDFTKP
jgi:hypothetical protein